MISYNSTKLNLLYHPSNVIPYMHLKQTLQHIRHDLTPFPFSSRQTKARVTNVTKSIFDMINTTITKPTQAPNDPSFEDSYHPRPIYNIIADAQIVKSNQPCGSRYATGAYHQRPIFPPRSLLSSSFCPPLFVSWSLPRLCVPLGLLFAFLGHHVLAL